MTDLTTYGHRVIAVSGRARAQLAAIRKERLSRRNHARHVTAGASLMAPMLATAGAPRDALADAAREALPKAEQTPGVTDATIDLATVEPVPDDATCDVAADAPLAEDPSHEDLEDAGPATDAARDPADARMAEPDDAGAPHAHWPLTGDLQGGEWTQSLIGQPGHADTDALLRHIAPEGNGGADGIGTSVSWVTAPFLLTAELVASTSEAALSQPDPAGSFPEPIVAASDPDAPTPGATDAIPQEAGQSDAEETAGLAAADCGAQSDLFQIPGIGTGLVWMMQSAGIQCLDDLARAKTRELEERLGMISRLLDLDYFVEFARAREARP